MKVAIIYGSASDRPVMRKAAEVLREFGVEYSAHVLSAHRTPALLAKTVRDLEAGGTELIIAGAGLAAHLPGVIAALTLLPVIGVPLGKETEGLGGMDALLSMVQMPKPVPVAVVGINNAANAAYLACRILALKYPSLSHSLAAFTQKMQADFAASAQGETL
jgi:5-(carboxyamino)imidazole ribonucleotide mutase